MFSLDKKRVKNMASANEIIKALTPWLDLIKTSLELQQSIINQNRAIREMTNCLKAEDGRIIGNFILWWGFGI